MKIAVIGGTGLVGTEMISILAERNFPVTELVIFASPRSEGKVIQTPFGEVTCRVAKFIEDFEGCDFVIVDVDDPYALELAPMAAQAGAKVIDNSAAFRMDVNVPLVVSEVNPGDIAYADKGIVACPNCTTMILMVALGPLHEKFKIDRMVISTFQSVSGAGQVGIDELAGQWKSRGFDDDVDSLLRASRNTASISGGEVWDKAIAGNVIPLAGSVQESGYTSEEEKLVFETHKILHDDSILVTATCVRVPVFVGHALSVNVSFHDFVDASMAVKVLQDAKGIILDQDLSHEGAYPTPLETAGGDGVRVGRIRNDRTQPNTLNLWITGDNLRKGAALNAVEIAELWV
jgi:aspartate-semialdehyde dehydrogenase